MLNADALDALTSHHTRPSPQPGLFEQLQSREIDYLIAAAVRVAVRAETARCAAVALAVGDRLPDLLFCLNESVWGRAAKAISASIKA